MPDGAQTLAPFLCATVAVGLVAVIGTRRPGITAPMSVIAATLTFAGVIWLRSIEPPRLDLDWAPTWDLRLTFDFDGLALLYALLASGIGIAVVVFSSRYLPLHLEHDGRPRSATTRFYALLLLFMASMIGLVAAQDLILLFVFWDLTAIASYFLIGYDTQKPDARSSALMALLVTGVSSVGFIIGAAMLYARYETFSLPTLFDQAEAGTYLTVAVALMMVPGLAKSAQVPLHFWLPRAMVAPTPVSAYLHSAAMVAAGVFLLSRIHPLIAHSELLLDSLIVIGFLSMAIGGLLALTADVLKQVLAYSTIAQYGYVVVMLGFGGEYGLVGASFYVIAHALAKSALFLTAGSITEATGQDRLSRVGGLAGSLPLLAVASGLAAAGLAALPLTIGFFKDELFFAAALERGGLMAVLAVVGAALTLAYMWRFWSGLFLGQRRSEAQRLPAMLVAPVACLSLLVLLGGIFVRPAAVIAEAAGQATFLAPTPLKLAYHLDTRTENLLALASYATGVAIVSSRRLWLAGANAVVRLGIRIGPERAFTGALATLNQFSTYLLQLEVRGLRRRVATILVPAAALMLLGLLLSPTDAIYRVGAVRRSELPLAIFLGLAALAALAVTRSKRHLALALALSCVGFSLAAVYAFLGAPNVALVAVLIETLLTVLFVAMLSLFPADIRDRESMLATPRRLRWRDPFVAVVAASFAFMVAWGAFSRPSPTGGVAEEHIELTPDAHAKDVVTAILADFRGLDTAGEVTVIAIVLVGVVSLLRERLRL